MANEHAGLSVQQASIIDTKIDDGFPLSGNVTIMLMNGVNGGCKAAWSDGTTSTYYFATTNNWDVNPPTGSTTSCFDNGGYALPTKAKYSLSQNGGTGVNCALSFKFQ